MQTLPQLDISRMASPVKETKLGYDGLSAGQFVSSPREIKTQIKSTEVLPQLSWQLYSGDPTERF